MTEATPTPEHDHAAVEAIITRWLAWRAVQLRSLRAMPDGSPTKTRLIAVLDKFQRDLTGAN